MSRTVPRTRRPAVAGYFYPAQAAELIRGIEALTRGALPAREALAVIVPHGSFRHAGRVTGPTLASVRIPRRCVILGPSHTGSGMRWSLMIGGAYRTPLGDVPVDTDCAQALRQRCPFLEPDPWAQHGEHAIEVLLPFLQRLGPADLTIVPIVIGSAQAEEADQLARAMAQVVRMLEEPVLLVASADLSQYVPQDTAAAQDRALLEAIGALRPASLRQEIERRNVQVCGEDAVACILEAANTLGARDTTLIRYSTSAEAGGDPHAATGYAGVVIESPDG